MPPKAAIPILPPARTGFDYALANVSASATGGQPAYTFALLASAESALPPVGLVIDPATGKLSGIITSLCGAYPFRISVTDTLGAIDIIPATIFVDSMVNGFDILARLPIKDQPGCVMAQLNLIAASMLALLTDMTNIPFTPSGSCALPSFTGEALNRNQYSSLAFTQWRPVQAISSARQAGGAAIKVGTMEDLLTGKAEVAIDNQGRAVRFICPARYDGPSYTIINYTAGFGALPADLYEVFCELSLLAYKEKDRGGLKSLMMGDATTAYDKELPGFIFPILEKYTRVGQMV